MEAIVNGRVVHAPTKGELDAAVRRATSPAHYVGGRGEVLFSSGEYIRSIAEDEVRGREMS